EEKSPFALSDSDYGNVKQLRFPYIPVALYIGTLELARLNDIDRVFILTEQRLAQHFRKLGAKVYCIGDAVEYRGQRIPSMMRPQEIIGGLPIWGRSFYRAVAADIAGMTH